MSKLEADVKGKRSLSVSGMPSERAIASLMDHIGLKLTFAANTFLELYRSRLRELDLTPSRVLALSIIQNEPGLVQKSLAEALSVNQASAMATVNKLEASGYVRRAKGKDKRSKALFITKQGKVTFERSLECERQLSSELVASFSSDEQEQLAVMLDKIRTEAVSVTSG